MSRRLGAAFLNHQVEQLEKSVNSNNWRDRRRDVEQWNSSAPAADGAGVGTSPPKIKGGRGAGARKVADAEDKDEPGKATSPAAHQDTMVSTRAVDEKFRPKVKEKDADIVVVDASVLVHALYQVKKWCREGREETVVIPLEGPYSTH